MFVALFNVVDFAGEVLGVLLPVCSCLLSSSLGFAHWFAPGRFFWCRGVAWYMSSCHWCSLRSCLCFLSSVVVVAFLFVPDLLASVCRSVALFLSLSLFLSVEITLFDSLRVFRRCLRLPFCVAMALADGALQLACVFVRALASVCCGRVPVIDLEGDATDDDDAMVPISVRVECGCCSFGISLAV